MIDIQKQQERLWLLRKVRLWEVQRSPNEKIS